MRSERLSASSSQLPDLVAFNARIRERIDPLLDRKWVRRALYVLVAGFVLFAGMWLYFASGLPSSEKLLAYQPSLPTNVRGYDGTPVQTFARERRVELSYEELPPVLVNAFISAEDKTFFSHGGLDYPGLVGAVFDFTAKTATGGGRARGGSTITQQVAKYLLQDSSYSRGHPCVPAGVDPFQAADPRDLSQLDLPRPECLRRSGREPRLFRQGRQ